MKLPLWKKALFSLLVTGLFFLVLEFILWACGVESVLDDDDPFVGFSGYVPLFVEAASPDGEPVMATARNKLKYFNAQRFPARKGVGTFRIFCVGGSTTFGRPYDDTTSFCGWLRESLKVADPSRTWEVINAGGISYASYRVALLLEELIDYEPDLFIVYSGHNEFLERRTYSRIFDVPSPVLGLGALVSGTRIYTAVQRLVNRKRGEEDSEKASRDELPAEVNTILDNSIGLDAYTRDDEYRQQVLAHYRFNLASLVGTARAAGAGVVLITPASNLRDCSPFKSQHREGLEEEDRRRWTNRLDHARDAMMADRHGDALSELDALAAVDDRYAQLHYLRGRVLYALRRYTDARTAFERALEEDVCPLRSLTTMRQTIHAVAAAQGVPVVEFAKIVEEHSDHGIAGALFLDHVHPTIEGNRLLALAILDEMISRRLVSVVPSWNEAAISAVKRDVESRLDSQAHAISLRNLAQVLRQGG